MLKKVLIVLAVILVSVSFLALLAAGLGAALFAPFSAVRSESQVQPVVVVETGSPAITPTRTPWDATHTPYVTVEPTATRTVAPTTIPTVIDICTDPVTLTAGRDGRISFQGVSFVLPAELGGQVEAWECPTAFIVANDFMASHPAYVAFRFPTDRERIFFQPELYVYRVEGDMNEYMYPLHALAELRAALGQRPEPAEGWFKAPLKIYGSYVPFAAGKAVRGVVQYAQDYFFYTNNALLYDFQGLTDDGRYSVHLQYPIAAPFLMDLEHSDPNTNTNPQAIPIPKWTLDYQAMNQVITDYNEEAMRRFEQLGESGFTPNLSLLDGLVTSLKIE